jgi:hypothetical protein
MDPFESPFWDLTAAAAWALIREPAAVRAAADPDNEAALFEVRAAHLARWGEVNERLWQESGWLKPNDPRDLRIEILAPDVDLPHRSAEGFAERVRELEGEGKIRLQQQNVFPILDYLLACFREGRLTASANAPGEARTRELAPIDWAPSRSPAATISGCSSGALTSGASPSVPCASSASKSSRSYLHWTPCTLRPVGQGRSDDRRGRRKRDGRSGGPRKNSNLR